MNVKLYGNDWSSQTGLDLLIQKGYKILELETYFTSGLEETRAWTIEKNCTAQKQQEKFIQILKKDLLELRQYHMRILLRMMGGIILKQMEK